MDVKSRIKKFLKYNKITATSFEKSINASNGYINSISKSIGLDKMDLILEKYPRLNLEWLLTGKGEMLKLVNYPENRIEHNIVGEENTTYQVLRKKDKSPEGIPLYHLEASESLASLFYSGLDAIILDYLKIPNLPKCDGALNITGESMYPLLKSGDIIIYKQIEIEISNIFFGEMYLISIDVNGDEYVSVRWVQVSDKGDQYIKLVSENKNHQTKDVAIKNIVALAIIKASVRLNTM